MKGTAGPFQSGYSTNIGITNKWIQTMHIHAKLRKAMREKLRIKTSSTHKELTDSGKSNHNKNVNFLKEKLRSYKTDQFSNGPAKIHAITGCDTTAYKYNIGKFKVMKKITRSKQQCALIQDIGRNESLSQRVMADTKTFVQTVMYSGKPQEGYVETRIRIYQNLKTKSSAAVPADPKSIWEDLQRVNLTCFIWLRCLDATVTRPDPNAGWYYEKSLNRLMPKWLTGEQLPPSLTDSVKRKEKASSQAQGNEADAEDEISNDEIHAPSAKRSRPVTRRRLEQPTREAGYSADSEAYAIQMLGMFCQLLNCYNIWSSALEKVVTLNGKVP
eukprot:Seg1472.14 transcript_id=Seg1472.14/GoldUCD/mRNA.D3Y31 product="hypothetical protein" protein_id=Seg1472.14/GoldUCD/D3Y31